MATLERRERGDETAATRWIARMVEASPDPRWLCGACGATAVGWKPVCGHCGAFDAIAWQMPGAGRDERSALPAPGGALLLP